MKYPKIDFKKYGESVFVSDGGWRSEVYYACIRPLRYKNKMYMTGNLTEIGHYDEGYYLYIGPPNILLEGLTLRAVLTAASGKKYSIFRTERVCVGSETVYVWAILRLNPKGD